MPYASEFAAQLFDHVLRNGLSMGRYLVLGLAAAAALQSLVPAEKLGARMDQHGTFAVIIASGIAVATPLCSCTTVSLMIPFLAAGIPWGPVFSWLIASPIISPTGLLLTGGTLGWHLALAKLLGGLMMGIGGGMLANKMQELGLLVGQSRVPLSRVSDTGSAGEGFECCPAATPHSAESCCEEDECGRLRNPRESVRLFGKTLWDSARSLVPIFVAFIIVAGVIEMLIPTEWVAGLFGADRAWSVPAAAVLGVPMYTCTAGAVPLVSSFLRLGMSDGAALAFILTGPGTSMPALGAVLVVARQVVYSTSMKVGVR